LRPCLLALEPFPLVLEATLLGLLRSLLPGTLKTLVVGSGLDHGKLLPFVASPRVCHGGDHDPFFMRIQAFSRAPDRAPASAATPNMKRKSQLNFSKVHNTL
jgi:hypothetical protein